MANVVELTDENFDTQIKSTTNPVLVDFFAPWCGHCRTQGPIIEELADEIGQNAVVAKINVDENREKASEYFISGIPAILVFKKGKLVEQKAGVHQKEELKKILSKYENKNW